MTKTNLMIVEDDADLLEALTGILEHSGFWCDQAKSAEEAIGLLNKKRYDMVISDVNLGEMDGLDLLKHIQVHAPEVNVLLMTAYGEINLAVQAIKLGAVDYLLKPFETNTLVQLVCRFTQGIPVDSDYQEPIAEELSSQQVFSLAKRVAASDSTVLISGESGTGKEVLARHIHRYSARAKSPFVAINCAAIPENMLEATLFGYEKGAFTGAYNSMPGKFEQANGGTLLLDEISEMDLSLQAKLLRVLQECEVERLGGRKVIPLDVRVLATTNRNMMEEVKLGRFREDLYYRLCVFPIQWLPLRERVGDILPLARYLLGHYGAKMNKKGIKLHSEVELALLKYQWPGNVRELGNVIQRALILQQGDEVTMEDLRLDDMTHLSETPSLDSSIHNLPPVYSSSVSMESDSHDVAHSGEQSLTGNDEVKVSKHKLGDDVRHHEYRLILDTLRQVNGHRKKTAEKLGISPRTLRYKIAKMREVGINIDSQISATEC